MTTGLLRGITGEASRWGVAAGIADEASGRLQQTPALAHTL
ncbi:MAG TPA: hypothetical protein VKR59_12350 [Terriglobales bacterium]|nr:hypothetical protein [Terriglobales bacterium]